MPYTTTDVVRLALEQDAANLTTAVDEVLLGKIKDALDVKRQEVAQSVFNQASGAE